MTNHKVLLFILISVQLFLLAQKTISQKTISQQHEKFVQRMKHTFAFNERKIIESNRVNTSSTGLNTFGGQIVPALFLLSTLNSEMLVNRAKDIQSMLGGFASKAPAGATMSIWAEHANRLKFFVEKRVLYAMEKMPPAKDVYTAASWTFLIYSLYQTTDVLSDMWMYESSFDRTGQGMKEIEPLIQDVEYLVGRIEELQNNIVTLLEREEIMDPSTKDAKKWKTNSFNNRKHPTIKEGIEERKISSFYDFAERYYDYSSQLFDLFQNIDNRLKEYIEKTKEDEQAFFNYQKKTFKSFMMHASYTVGAATLSYFFPPVAATYLPSVIGGIMAGLNGGATYVAKKHREKALYRLASLDQLEKRIQQRYEAFQIFNQNYADIINNIQHRIEEDGLKKVSPDNQISLLHRIFSIISYSIANPGLNFITNNAFTFLRVALFVTWLCIFGYLMYLEHKKDGLSHLKPPSYYVKYFTAFLAICVILFLAVDLFEAKNSTKTSLMHDRGVRVEEYKANLEQRYRHECIWHEISVYRQIKLEIMSLIYDLLLQDGSRFITTNSSGHLTNDPTCLSILQDMQTEQSSALRRSIAITDVEIVGEAYTSVFKGLFKPIMDVIIHCAESFTKETGFLTKIWLMLATSGFMFLTMKRLFLCC